jgi:hypothetical protein
MRIIDYKSFHGSEKREGYIAIPELHRTQSSVKQFIKLADLDITLTRPTAFLYVDGFSMSPSESGLNTSNVDNYHPVIKSGAAYIAHEWIYTFKNREHLVKVDIMSGTCAAGIQALYEAQRLLWEGEVEEVIIIGGERTTEDTMRLFKELRIPVTCGDGFAFMRLEMGYDITNVVWKYAFSKNPFMFRKEDLDTLAPGYHIGYVKLHGTGTAANTEAESGLAKLATPIIYKDSIGHTQGVSALVETCMLLDDPKIRGRILVTANGLGGFYGAFLLTKPWL